MVNVMMTMIMTMIPTDFYGFDIDCCIPWCKHVVYCVDEAFIHRKGSVSIDCCVVIVSKFQFFEYIDKKRDTFVCDVLQPTKFRYVTGW
jgi:hypothetical protein